MASNSSSIYISSSPIYIGESQQVFAIRVAMNVSASLSLVGTLFMILSGINFRELLTKSFAIKIIFIMSITDFLSSITYLSSPLSRTSEAFCKAQGILLQVLNLSTIMWTSCYAFALYLNVVKQKPDDLLQKYIWKFTIVSIGIPALSLISPLSYNAFDHQSSVPWCWIGSKYKILRIVCYYGIVVVAFFFNLILFIIVARFIKLHNTGMEKTIFRRLNWYILSFIVSWSPGTIHRIYNIVVNVDVFWLQLLHSILSPLHGFLNSVVYGFTLPILRGRYKYLLFKHSVEVTPFILSSSSQGDDKKEDNFPSIN